MRIEDVYKNLTGVDIVKQRELWDERGKGYYGEYLVFCELYRHVAGTGKILMNLNIPVDGVATTEVDLLLIHETGIYVFEIKHYKGVIYGKDTDATWTQYFRTVRNNVFQNPIIQNDYHMLALGRLFPNVPIHSVVVFTNEACELRVEISSPEIDICVLDDVRYVLQNRFYESSYKYSMEDIDCFFARLIPYSQMQKPVEVNHVQAPFYSWLRPVITGLETKKEELELEKQEYILCEKQTKREFWAAILIAVVVVSLCILAAFAYTNTIQTRYDLALEEKAQEYEQAIQNNTNELNAFKQNFLHVDEIGNEYIDSLQSYVAVSNVVLQPFSDDAVQFTAQLAMQNDTYGISLTSASNYIVMTTSGKVFEYHVFGEHLSYNWIAYVLGSQYRQHLNLDVAQFFGIVNPDDISYIKLTGIELFKQDIGRTVIKDGLEIELYSIE